MKKTNKQKLFEVFEKVCNIKLIKEDIQNINELELDDYSNLMNKTYNYPWIKFLGDKKKISKKYENINNLANQLFKREFYKKYPIGMEIKFGNNIYKFAGISFNTNYTNYSLMFDDFNGDKIIIVYNKSDGYYIRDSKIQDNLDDKSKNIIINMLKYNDFKIK